ncbi:unnamed protein product [Lactuca saligna]|uniref:Eukaryotic translation initiation factor isoform 4E n=1 Tax=Lactuca saligna TaxID=75948 RepID=A0AA35VGG9_LACSI|nr:unnamed protein product [Lactuca saligna]
MATDGAAVDVGGEVAEQPHRLDKKWTFWFDNQSKPKQGAGWGNNLRNGYTFDTVEEFWCLYDQVFKPSKLPGNADFHLFKAGIEPKWEDPECANGGKWTVTSSRKANLETMWFETLMALIGEQFDEADEICGVVASVRQRQDKLSLWTKNAANEAAQMSIGRKWKEIIDVTDKITYNFHDDSKTRTSKDEWFDDNDNLNDEHESCTDGENEDNIDELRNVDIEFSEDAMIMKRTSNDFFLSKLCVDKEEDNSIVNDNDEREIEPTMHTHSIFNDLLHWKKQKSILGMRFQDPGKLK